MIRWHCTSFASLDVDTLYDILSLREEVFAFEQNCHAIDLDGFDKQAIHVVGRVENDVIATARILPPGTYYPRKASFGRLAVKKDFRGRGFGDALLQTILNYINNNFLGIPIKFSAQFYLKSFYEKYGFVTTGDIFDEGGIQHVNMINS